MTKMRKFPTADVLAELQEHRSISV